MLNRMVNGLQQWGDSWCQRWEREVGRRWLNVGNPTVRWRGGGLYYRFGLSCIRLARHRTPSDLLANRLRMPKNHGRELVIYGIPKGTRPLGFRVKELLVILPDLGSVCVKREPQSDKVRLEVTIA
jgi:hypothetical protein